MSSGVRLTSGLADPEGESAAVSVEVMRGELDEAKGVMRSAEAEGCGTAGVTWSV